MTPRLKERYKKEIVQNLMSKLNYKNINAVPKIKKIVINMGLGQDGSDKKKMEVCIKDMSAITGQHPVITRFKKSISNICNYLALVRAYFYWLISSGSLNLTP